MGLFDIGARIKEFVAGEVSKEEKNAAFDQIQKATGVPIDEKQRMAILKANVDPNLLLAGFAIKQIKTSADSARAGTGLNQLQQPGGFEAMQSQLPAGGSVSQGGITANIPASPEVEQKKADMEVDTAVKKTEATKKAEKNLNRDELRKELGDFFLLDDLVPRVDGGYIERTIQGIQNVATGANQNDSTGYALAAHDGVRKRLRVKLVRAAGDVGNMNIVEQEAAEQIIPTKWDSKGTAALKRAYLAESAKAIGSMEEGPELQSEIKRVLNTFADSDGFNGPKGKEAEKLKKPYKIGETVEYGNKKYKVTNADNPFDPELEEITKNAKAV